MEKDERRFFPIFVMIIVLIVWGADFIVIEHMLQYMTSGVFTLLRLITGSIVLLAAVLIKNKGLYIRKKDWPRVFMCGAAAMSLFYTIEGIGIQMTSAAFSSLLLSTVPVIGIIADRIFFKRSIKLFKLICIMISVIGVYFLVAEELTGTRLIGMLTILTAAVLWVFQIVYIKPLYETYDLLTILTGIFLSGTLFQIPVTLASKPYIQITFEGMALVVITAIVCLVLGQAGYVYAVGKLSVTTVSAFENLLPVVTILLSFILYGTTLSGLQLAGVVLIIGPIMCMALKN